MNIALIDDEHFFIQELKSSLNTVLANVGISADKLDSFSSAKEFFSAWRAGTYDIIFLDIYMDGENGIDIARKIRMTDGDAVLIFCTSCNEFAAETYEVRARYYLNKPISEKKLGDMLKHLDLESLEKNRTVCLPDGFKCLLRHILYTEYINHTVIFHLKNAPSHTVYMNHSAAETLLLNYKTFKQINKGCIVNFTMVKRIDSGVFIMQNGTKVPIARRRYKEINDAYTKYRFEKMSEEVGE